MTKLTEHKYSEKSIHNWLKGEFLLGQVNFINEKGGWGRITVYRNDKVLLSPDGQKVDKAWFSLIDSYESIYKDDWVVFEPMDASLEEKLKNENPYLMQARPGSLQVLKNISEIKKLLPETIKKLDSKLKENYIDSIRIFGKKIFIASKFAEKIEEHIKEHLAYKFDLWHKEEESKIRQRESELEAARKNFEDYKTNTLQSLEKEKLEIEQASERVEWVKEQLNELEKSRLSIQKYAKEIDEKRKLWGLEPFLDTEVVVEQKFDKFESEKGLIKLVDKYINSLGYEFSYDQIVNYYTCLKTGAIVILAGLSGTGKSSLVREFANAIGAEFVLVPVKATWSDDTDLLGFYHPERKTYISTVLLDTIVNANANPDKMYFVCLDEMNLSRVEYYLSDLLSVLEQGEYRKLTPYSKSEWRVRKAQLRSLKNEFDNNRISEEEYYQYEKNVSLFRYEIPVPQNIFFSGTVNIDETTHPFSDKVLDRAQIIQYTDVEFRDQIVTKQKVLPTQLSFTKFCEFSRKTNKMPIDHNWFNQLNRILRHGGFHFGYRVKNQIEDYISYAMRSDLFSSKDPNYLLDLQISQKILPKIKGINTQQLQESFFPELRDFCTNKHPISYEIVQTLQEMESINFWQVFRHGK